MLNTLKQIYDTIRNAEIIYKGGFVFLDLMVWGYFIYSFAEHERNKVRKL